MVVCCLRPGFYWKAPPSCYFHQAQLANKFSIVRSLERGKDMYMKEAEVKEEEEEEMEEEEVEKGESEKEEVEEGGS